MYSYYLHVNEIFVFGGNFESVTEPITLTFHYRRIQHSKHSINIMVCIYQFSPPLHFHMTWTDLSVIYLGVAHLQVVKLKVSGGGQLCVIAQGTCSHMTRKFFSQNFISNIAKLIQFFYGFFYNNVKIEYLIRFCIQIVWLEVGVNEKKNKYQTLMNMWSRRSCNRAFFVRGHS